MKTSKWVTASVVSVVGGLAAWWLIKNSRLCVQTARYKILLKEGSFEVREYGPLPLVGTPDADHDDSFERLFGYISGENDNGCEIAMTTPVLISEEYGRRTMNFVLPDAVIRAGVPRPKSLDIEHMLLPGGEFAAYRYAGFNNLLAESGNAAVLRSWMRERALESVGEALIALYDPPWIPAPMRRNEVLLRISGNDWAT